MFEAVSVPPAHRQWFGLVRQIIADELNIREVDLAGDGGEEVIQRTLAPNFRALGRAFGPRTQRVAAAIRAADPRRVAAALAAGGRVTLDADGEPAELDSSMVTVTEAPVTGWQLSAAGGYSVALDLTIDAGLRRAGLAREFTRLVNDQRKQAGFALADRVSVRVHLAEDPGSQVRRALAEHREAIAAEVLAASLAVTSPDGIFFILHGDPRTVNATAGGTGGESEEGLLRLGAARLQLDIH